MKLEHRDGSPVIRTIIYIVCIFLAILSLFPFVIMIVNSTRSTFEIQQHAVSLIPSTFLKSNWEQFTGKSFNPMTGFINSVIVAVGATACTVYFSTLTAYALVAYQWKLRQPFFTFILCVMMIPATVTMSRATMIAMAIFQPLPFLSAACVAAGYEGCCAYA